MVVYQLLQTKTINHFYLNVFKPYSGFVTILPLAQFGILLYFIFIIIHYHTPNKGKCQFVPRVKSNHKMSNIYTKRNVLLQCCVLEALHGTIFPLSYLLSAYGLVIWAFFFRLKTYIFFLFLTSQHLLGQVSEHSEKQEGWHFVRGLDSNSERWWTILSLYSESISTSDLPNGETVSSGDLTK